MHGSTAASLPKLIRHSLFFLFWTGIALLWALRLYLLNAGTNNPMPWWEAYLLCSIEWYLWGTASLFVYWLCQKLRPERYRIPTLILIHLSVGIALSLLILIPFNAAYRPIEVYFMKAPLPPDMAEFWTSYFGWFKGRFHLFLMNYALITVACYALQYYKNFRTQELRASQLQTELAQAQLHTLKAQLHPHFLFNTLNTISSLVHTDPDGAEKMISRLGDLLRLTLQSNQSQMTSLRNEMEFTQLYLEIQQIRFSDRLKVELSIEPDTLEAKIPALLLQPLVENAIVHGISPRTTTGTVKVVSMHKSNRLHLTIADDGVGIKTDAISFNGSGIGLKNIKQRLQYLYGENHSFALSTFPNSGVKIEIEIPFESFDAASEKSI